MKRVGNERAGAGGVLCGSVPVEKHFVQNASHSPDVDLRKEEKKPQELKERPSTAEVSRRLSAFPSRRHSADHGNLQANNSEPSRLIAGGFI